MTLVICELIWLKQLFNEPKFEKNSQMLLICANHIALHVTSNLAFHEKTRHIEIDCHLIREKLESGDIIIIFLNSIEYYD